MLKNIWRIFTVLLCFLLMAEASGAADEKWPDFWMVKGREELRQARQRHPITHRAKNVILFIGDGMGISTVTAARILKGQLKGNTGEEDSLSFEAFPNVALSKTYSLDYQTTDSASTATAFLCGVKTNKGTLAVSGRVARDDCPAALQHSVDSVLDWALASGRAVGVVTTTRVTHATPAAAYAHSANRDWEGDVELPQEAKGQGCKDIAAQLVENQPNVQVVLGGGRRYFMPAAQPDPEDGSTTDHRTDNRDLIQEWLADKQSRSLKARYVWNATDFDSVDPESTDYLLGLFEPSHMNYELDRLRQPNGTEAGEPSLAEMVEKAVRILRRNKHGFFLLVEGGRIDHGHHASTAARALHETLALDAAVTMATSLTKKEDTLTVVTADHSHVMVISGYPTRGNPILGTLDSSKSDGKPYTTILYGNGPGYEVVDGGRPNITGVDTADKDYIQQSGVYMRSETHGGEDVAIFAQGPSAHLFHGVHEQSYIAHVLGYAACIGPYSTWDSCPEPRDHGPSNGASHHGNFIQFTARAAAKTLRTFFSR